MAEYLIEDGAEIHVYDPKVSEAKIKADLRYVWDLKGVSEEKIIQKLTQVTVYTDPMKGVYNAHAVAVLTEWDEFTTYDWKTIYENMYKPAFVFDGRNILDAAMMKKIGFHFKGIGKG